MGTRWLWNFTQFTAGDRFMTEDDMRDIPYPATELGIHIAFKNVQAGSLIGGFIVAPLLPLIRKSGQLAKLKFKHRMGICGRRGILAGLLVTPIMEYAFIKGFKVDQAGLQDRCYRIRYHKKQLLIDRTTFVVGTLGFCALRWTGMVLGINIALLTCTAFNALLFDRVRHLKLWGGDQMEVPDPHYKPPKV